MNRKFWTFALLVALMGAPSMFAQEDDGKIVIVDKDGKQIGAAQIQIEAQDDDGPISIGRQFKIEGDKIIITDENGERREIDISGARSVSVQQSVKSVDNDGEQKTVAHGKAIIIGPDGEKQVIELGAPLDGAEGNGVRMMFGTDLPEGLFVGDEPMALKFFRSQIPGEHQLAPSKYMIGVNCEPVGDQIRAHLNLESGVGLIIQSVSEESPAETAGIQKHDILMFADDTELTSVADLSEVVERAGKENKSFSLTAIRAGNEISLKIKPVERPADLMRNDGFFFGDPEMKMQFRQLGPGIIVGDGVGLPEEMQKQMDEIRERMRQVELEMKQRMMDLRIDQDKDDDNGN